MASYAKILELNFPNDKWAVSGDDYQSLQWFSNTPKPTASELNSLSASTDEMIAKKNCQQQASSLLFDTDWTTIPDVADPINSPYLTNQAEFIAYRNQVRQLAVNPVVAPIFPPKPSPIWS